MFYFQNKKIAPIQKQIKTKITTESPRKCILKILKLLFLKLTSKTKLKIQINQIFYYKKVEQGYKQKKIKKVSALRECKLPMQVNKLRRLILHKRFIFLQCDLKKIRPVVMNEQALPTSYVQI